jgi:hypothetical protein
MKHHRRESFKSRIFITCLQKTYLAFKINHVSVPGMKINEGIRLDETNFRNVCNFW